MLQNWKSKTIFHKINLLNLPSHKAKLIFLFFEGGGAFKVEFVIFRTTKSRLTCIFYPSLGNCFNADLRRKYKQAVVLTTISALQPLILHTYE